MNVRLKTTHDSKLELNDRHTSYTMGGSRIIPPDKTVHRMQSILEEQGGMSILYHKLSDYSKIRIPVFLVQGTKDDTESVTGMGKGLTDDAAKASGIMELIERYSAREYSVENIVRASYNEVRNKAIDPFHLLFSAEQNYDHDKQIDFTWGYSLTNKRSVLVPASFSYFAYNCKVDNGTIVHVRDNISTLVSSNGLAAGNCMEEAILHGIYELVERDATFIMWLNKLCVPDVDVSTITNGYINNAIQAFADSGIDLHIKCATNDINDIHTFFCLGVDKCSGEDYPALGFGCGTHLNPEIALSRALTELSQVMISILLHKKNMDNKDYQQRCDKGHMENVNNFWSIESLSNFTFLISHGSDSNIVQFSSLEDRSCDNIKVDIKTCIDIIASKGLEVVVVNLTLNTLGIPVVRVIIPGLQPPVKKRYSQIYTDRLFKVPVELGYPRTSEGLNSFELI
jgi:ribosomal protein S12 methylthiotransferase accessory factor